MARATSLSGHVSARLIALSASLAMTWSATAFAQIPLNAGQPPVSTTTTSAGRPTATGQQTQSTTPASAPAAAVPASPLRVPQSCETAIGQWRVDCLRQLYRAVPAQWPTPAVDAGVSWKEWVTPPTTHQAQTWLADNPGRAQLMADVSEPAIVTLGTTLFFDQRLSRGGAISCASCHQPSRSFTDGRSLAVGEDGLMGRRRSPPLFAAPFAPSLFWDGRAASLQAQVVEPIADGREMNHSVAEAAARLQNEPFYRDAFRRAYGDDAISGERLARSLAAYVATIRPPATRFDAFLSGDTQALNDQELLGMHLFRTQARCINCHNGALLTDNQFHNMGLSFLGRRNQDLGRYEVTRDPADIGKFRTPSLRQVSQAGPWMHNGLFPNLEGLLRLYNAGMPPDPRPTDTGLTAHKSTLLKPLSLTPEEIKALAAFLQVL